jgi:hypothetical protein
VKPNPANPTLAPVLVNARDAAAALAISARKLWSLTAGGDVRCVRIGRAMRYDVADLRAYVERCKGGRR